MPPGDVANKAKLYLEFDCKEFFLMIMLVAFIAVDVMLDKLVTGSHRLEYKSILFKSHLYSEPLQGELRHSDVTRSLLEADTIAPQSTKHLKRKKRH